MPGKILVLICCSNNLFCASLMENKALWLHFVFLAPLNNQERVLFKQKGVQLYKKKMKLLHCFQFERCHLTLIKVSEILSTEQNWSREQERYQWQSELCTLNSCVFLRGQRCSQLKKIQHWSAFGNTVPGTISSETVVIGADFRSSEKCFSAQQCWFWKVSFQ